MEVTFGLLQVSDLDLSSLKLFLENRMEWNKIDFNFMEWNKGKSKKATKNKTDFDLM